MSSLGRVWIRARVWVWAWLVRGCYYCFHRCCCCCRPVQALTVSRLSCPVAPPSLVSSLIATIAARNHSHRRRNHSHHRRTARPSSLSRARWVAGVRVRVLGFGFLGCGCGGRRRWSSEGGRERRVGGSGKNGRRKKTPPLLCFFIYFFLFILELQLSSF